MRAQLSTLLLSAILCLPATAMADVKAAFKKENCTIVAEGHQFTEGPTLDDHGNILFTSPKQNSIFSFSITSGSTSLYCQKEDPISALYFQHSKLYATQGPLKRVVGIKSANEFVPLAESFNDAPFNKPNDLWVSPQGRLYFTDPNYGPNPLSQEGEFAYWINPDGKIHRIEAAFVRPNGIVGSADGKTLFITDAGDSKTYRFDLGEDGSPGKQELFTDIGGDGMALDAQGNLYIAVPKQKALVAIDPSGKEIARISDFGCSNVCFGPEGKILYITKVPGLWALKIY